MLRVSCHNHRHWTLLITFLIFIDVSKDSFAYSLQTYSKSQLKMSAATKIDGHESSDKVPSTLNEIRQPAEGAGHLEGIEEVYKEMRQKPLIVRAYRLGSDKCPKASSSNDNIKKVYFIRHGQGFHNFLADVARQRGITWEPHTRDPNNPYIAPEILDAPLTEVGTQQAIQLQERVLQLMMHHTTRPQLVMVSPLRRATATGLLAFQKLLHFDDQVKVMAHEMLREEMGIHPCDQRRPISLLQHEFPQVDYSLILPRLDFKADIGEDTLFDDNVREDKLQVAERAYAFMEWLSQRPEQCVGIATHSAWLLTLFNGVLECVHDDDDGDKSLNSWFGTGEMRTVVLEFITKEEQQ